MNLADIADASVQSLYVPPAAVTHKWQILVEIGGEWLKIPFTGTGCKAVAEANKYIDIHHDRWARGHDGKCLYSSDGETAKKWKHFFAS